jgi:hypothetical protein
MSADLQQQTEAPQEAPQPEVEQPSAANPDAAQSETTAEVQPPEGDKTDKQVRRNMSAIQNRFDELTRARHDERRRAEAAEARAAELETKLRGAAMQAEEPRLEQFENFADYSKAMARHEANRLVSEKLEKFAQDNLRTFQERDQQERATHVAQQFNTALNAVEKDGAAKFKDFADVVANGPKLGPQVGQMVLATEAPAEISYYLAKNPEHALAIASMHPALAMRELGKLEVQITSKRVTSAPPPPRTVGGTSDTSSRGLSDDLSPDEWYRRRAAQQNRKR